jgi:hypothetical protein
MLFIYDFHAGGGPVLYMVSVSDTPASASRCRSASVELMHAIQNPHMRLEDIDGSIEYSYKMIWGCGWDVDEMRTLIDNVYSYVVYSLFATNCRCLSMSRSHDLHRLCCVSRETCIIANTYREDTHRRPVEAGTV